MDVYDFTPFEPTECLYCPNVPDSREHILQRSVGGRLQARVICSSCNNRLGDLVDQPFADVFALFVHALQIPKQGGERGVSLRATDVDGRRATIDANFNVSYEPTIKYRSDGKPREIIHPDVTHVDKISRGLQGTPAVEIITRPKTFKYEIASDERLARGALKVAFQFAQAFGTETTFLKRDTRDVVYSILTGDGAERNVAYTFHKFGIEEGFFHEVATYPIKYGTVVTLLLFNTLPVAVKLPGIPTTRACRYLQHFGVDVRPIISTIQADVSGIRVVHPFQVATFQAEAQRRVDVMLARKNEIELEDMFEDAFERSLLFDGRRVVERETFLELFEDNLKRLFIRDEERSGMVARALQRFDDGPRE